MRRRRTCGKDRAVLSRLRREDGFGLIEVVISLAVLQVAVFALVGTLSSSHTALVRASKTSTAAAMASKELEKYRAESYANIPVGTQPTRTESGPDGRSYVIATNITEDSALILKTVTVVVSDASDPGRPLVRQRTEYSHLTGW